MEKENKDIELLRGYKEYEAKVKNLNGIFAKIEDIFDISEYQESLKQIKIEVNSNANLKNKMPSDTFQLDFESMVLAPYIKRLEKIELELETNILPFYELYLLYTKINMQIDKITENTISEIIDNTKKLINSLNSLNTHDNEDKNNIIKKSYKTIYLAMLNEAMFGRTDILNYVKKLNVSVNIENIGRLLANDLNKLSKEDLIDEDLKVEKSEKLGNDYLTEELISKVSTITVGDNKSVYNERKRKEISKVYSNAVKLTKNKEELTNKLDTNNNKLQKYYLRRSLLTAKIFTLALIPVVSFGVGKKVGKNISNNITEYQTITRTIDYNTGKIIGETETKYNEVKSPYTATVLVCTPWRDNPAGLGYIRNVTTYEYNVPNKLEENYHITEKDLQENVSEKYTYVERKDTLDENENMVDNTILITESYQDGIYRTSKKWIVPGALIGAFGGLIIDIVLLLLGIYDLEEIRKKFIMLNEEINNNKLENKEIKNKLKELYKEALEVKTQYNEVVKQYGDFGTHLITENIDTSWLLTDTKKKIK